MPFCCRWHSPSQLPLLSVGKKPVLQAGDPWGHSDHNQCYHTMVDRQEGAVEVTQILTVRTIPHCSPFPRVFENMCYKTPWRFLNLSLQGFASMKFNSSMVNAFWVLLPTGGIFFIFAFWTMKGPYYFFDPKHNTDPRLKDAGDFETHSGRYQELAKLLVTLSGAAIAFLITMMVNEKAPTPFTQRLAAVAPIVVGYFGASIACLILFMLLQTYCYEQYCHSAIHDTYKRWKYALNISLCWTGLFAFVLGFAWLGFNLF